MSSYSLSPRHIRQRARSLGLRKETVDEFLNLVFRWLKESGEEWTVDRLKGVRADIIQYAASGRKPVTRWVARTKSGNFRGVLGHLQSLAAQSPRLLRKVNTLLMVYTSWVSKEVTERQYAKFFDSVRNPRLPVPSSYVSLVETVAKGFRLRGLAPADDFLSAKTLRPNHERRYLEGIAQFFGTLKGSMLFASSKLVWEPLMSSNNFLRKRRMSAQPHIGEIHVTQEPGYKARFFASPEVWVHHVLEPLKRSLLSLLRDLPWDGTHNQRVADTHIMTRLQNREKVWAFDLSDATNTFPLVLQMAVLQSMLEDEDMEWATLFGELCKFPWKYGDEMIVWARGQALGLGPSFPIFALTHGFLLFGLLGGSKFNNEFFIIGDDVVILDEGLAKAYEQALVDLDLEYSPAKSLVSDKITEFGGMLFDSSGPFYKMKWKGVRDENLLDMVRLNGREFLSVLRPSVRKRVERLALAPEPIGLGWNPEGFSLEFRLAGLEDFLWSEPKEEPPRDVNPARRVMKRWMELNQEYRKDMRVYLGPTGRDALQSAEQAVQSEVHRVLGSRVAPLYSVLGANLSIVAGKDSRLPAMIPQRVRRQPTLGQLSLKVRKLERYFRTKNAVSLLGEHPISRKSQKRH